MLMGDNALVFFSFFSHTFLLSFLFLYSSMLMREAERKQLCYCISGPAEVALQRAPFFREISSSKFQENVIAERIWKSGCCVTESGMIQHWKNIGKEKEAEKMLESETLVRLSIGKIKFVQIATKMSPVANTVTIDCNQSLATEGLVFFVFSSVCFFMFQNRGKSRNDSLEPSSWIYEDKHSKCVDVICKL